MIVEAKVTINGCPVEILRRRVTSAPQKLVRSALVEDAQVHGPGVQINATIESVLSLIEAQVRPA